MKKYSTQGFTLIEMLVVIAIIGVLAALTTSNLLRLNEANKLREGMAQFTQDIERARTAARRFSQRYQLLIPTPPSTTYTFRPILATTATPTPDSTSPAPTITGVLVANTRIRKVRMNSVTISGAYGRLEQATFPCYAFELVTSTFKPQAQISLVGVTGKVVQRAILYNPSAATLCP
jgi:prepilin-type N-terminal cleavage/methylation domain-containing protein